VLPPWYLQWWALVLFALATAAMLWGGYRARVAYLLGLERQRTRIAMDLHDEMGSGLGSIGILAGVLANNGRADETRAVARTMSQTAEELGAALSDIVWSLDPRASTLEELAGRLAEHGERLFSAAGVDFTIRFPTRWPAVRLSLPLRRDVLLIGYEALYNAARHARARQVTLALEPKGRQWQLSVQDDGVGLPEGALAGASVGRGLRSMRRRAEEIGAELQWRAAPGGGTLVALVFALRVRRPAV
jgi:signal transduction histidine kinase